jgi:hypothetical protein
LEQDHVWRGKVATKRRHDNHANIRCRTIHQRAAMSETLPARARHQYPAIVKADTKCYRPSVRRCLAPLTSTSGAHAITFASSPNSPGPCTILTIYDRICLVLCGPFTFAVVRHMIPLHIYVSMHWVEEHGIQGTSVELSGRLFACLHLWCREYECS